MKTSFSVIWTWYSMIGQCSFWRICMNHVFSRDGNTKFPKKNMIFNSDWLISFFDVFLETYEQLKRYFYDYSWIIEKCWKHQKHWNDCLSRMEKTLLWDIRFLQKHVFWCFVKVYVSLFFHMFPYFSLQYFSIFSLFSLCFLMFPYSSIIFPLFFYNFHYFHDFPFPFFFFLMFIIFPYFYFFLLLLFIFFIFLMFPYFSLLFFMFPHLVLVLVGRFFAIFSRNHKITKKCTFWMIVMLKFVICQFHGFWRNQSFSETDWFWLETVTEWNAQLKLLGYY